jgi:hypothetical protein
MFMNTTGIFHRIALALLPATLLIAACSKTDTPVPAPVDRGRVVFVNAASHIAPTTLKFLVDNSEKASLAYGLSSGYQDINPGTRTLQVAAGAQTALTQSITVDKEKNYTFVATPASAASAVGGLLITDDLVVPTTTGQGRIRLINLGQGTPTPLRLAQIISTVNGPVVADIVTNVPSNSASAFTEFTVGVYNLSVLDANGNTVAVVGDGSGAGTGTRKFAEGKIYTILLSGTQGSLNVDQKVKAFLLTNN